MKPGSLPWVAASGGGRIPGALPHRSPRGAAMTPNAAPEVIKSPLLRAILPQTARQKRSLKPLIITSPATSFNFRYHPPVTTGHRYLLLPSPLAEKHAIRSPVIVNIAKCSSQQSC